MSNEKESFEILFNISNELEYLGASLSVCGNTKLSDDMFYLATRVRKNTQLLVDERSKEINQRMDDADQANRNMMEGIFAGIEIGKNKD